MASSLIVDATASILAATTLLSTVQAQTVTSLLDEQVAAMHAASDTPGLSIAVIADGTILWAEGYGVRVAGAEDAVTQDTLFQAASISKPIAALAALRLVDEGSLQLDDPAEDLLGDWVLDYAEGKDEELVTLRHLLSHTAGTTVHGFPGYGIGTEVPDLIQVLDGEGNTDAIRVDKVPGLSFRYSGGGYCVMQRMLTEVAGVSFPQLMKQQVLDPLGMAHSTYEQPLPKNLHGDAALAHHGDGTPYDVPFFVHPEMAAAGLWTTPSDLARALLAMAAAVRGDADGFLSQELANDAINGQPGAGQQGLGWGVGKVPPGRYFGHGGSNQGYKCFARYVTGADLGVVVMVNSDDVQLANQVQKAAFRILLDSGH